MEPLRRARTQSKGGRVMRKSAAISLLAIALLLVLAMPSYAWRGHNSVFIGVGPVWWGPPYWYAPPPYYVYSPPPVVVQEPPVYVQAAPAPTSPPQAYWYYCPSLLYSRTCTSRIDRKSTRLNSSTVPSRM